ncbi:hypothetical protein P691DRAFT_781089 [Macrolepiota fuliginosa MF-IS2]|uniref:Uncharacterized protein n=1 Tax=Macrolepiota fuliginosa MF-IS2 TaxID=1400762 RepID=A0A9P5XF66_9AGAR|nr:hypothetical protein P691DRAFT_781089 [Macrolepiota fuliginosa MF-IS2]
MLAPERKVHPRVSEEATLHTHTHMVTPRYWNLTWRAGAAVPTPYSGRLKSGFRSFIGRKATQLILEVPYLAIKPIIAATLAFVVGSNAISCQEQGDGIKPTKCVYGNCPKGYRSVPWDDGCAGKGAWFRGDPQTCCV